MNEEVYEREVAGEYNTFQVYVYLLRVRKTSVRDVQRALGFSSPTLALHHLEKLLSLELAVKDSYGDYNVVPKSFGILRSFVIVGSSFVPRTIFVVAAFLAMTLVFLANLPANGYLVWALLPSVLGLAVSVFQTVQYRRLLLKKLYKK
jgi:hypothetical protein